MSKNDDECVECGRVVQGDTAAAVCVACYRRTEGRWEQKAILEAPLRIANLVWWRLVALIVLWYGLDWIGHYVHWLWMGIVF